MWPEQRGFFASTIETEAPVSEGTVIKKNKERIEGYIKMVTHYYSGTKIGAVPLLPFGKKQKSDIIETDLTDIDDVVIKSRKGPDSTRYMPIRSAMWKILAEKSGTRICAQTFETYGSEYAYSIEMVLVSGNDVIDIPISNSNIFRKRRLLMIEFIKNRYGQKFKPSDFKDERAVIEYIIEAEYKKRP